jgi:hypothetical protein
MSAANAGYYRANATVTGPDGIQNVSVSGYHPAAAAIAQSLAAAQNDAMISSVVAQGRSPAASTEKNDEISIRIGDDVRRLSVPQGRIG